MVITINIIVRPADLSTNSKAAKGSDNGADNDSPCSFPTSLTHTEAHAAIMSPLSKGDLFPSWQPTGFIYFIFSPFISFFFFNHLLSSTPWVVGTQATVFWTKDRLTSHQWLPGVCLP